MCAGTENWLSLGRPHRSLTFLAKVARARADFPDAGGEGEAIAAGAQCGAAVIGVVRAALHKSGPLGVQVAKRLD